jgi:hypothetical protein
MFNILDVEEYVDDDAKVGEDPADAIADKLNQKVDVDVDAKDKVDNGKANGNDHAKVEEDLVDIMEDKFNEKVGYILFKYLRTENLI